MQAFQIDIGAEYGYRDNPQRTEKLQHVKVLQHVRKRWKVQWINPNRGLVDYVRSAQLVVAWQERRAFLSDEAQWTRLTDACRRTWPGRSNPVAEAVDLVFDSTGEVAWLDESGALSATPDGLGRIAARAGSEVEVIPPAFLDRDGVVRAPFDLALDLARDFAKAEPRTVLLEVETTERRYEREASEIGNEFLVPHLNRRRAGWALCRQWANFDEAIAQRDREIDRLHRILEDLRYDLRKDGFEDLAAKLHRKVKG